MRYFRSETKKMNIIIEFRILESLWVPNNFEILFQICEEVNS